MAHEEQIGETGIEMCVRVRLTALGDIELAAIEIEGRELPRQSALAMWALLPEAIREHLEFDAIAQAEPSNETAEWYGEDKRVAG